MSFYRAKPAKAISGEIFLPGDKSIANRSIIISAIAKGKTYIYNFPTNQDCLMTINAFKNLRVKIKQMNSLGSDSCIYVEGKGLNSLKKPRLSIFTGESGTTFRLLLGVLAGQQFSTTLTAGKSLSLRPMRRITEPLRKMNADVRALTPNLARQKRGSKKEEYPPITLKGGKLRSITYRMPVASAQVKSALLLAGLYAKGVTKVIEPVKTRDHTERMLRDFRAEIMVKNKTISIRGQRELVSPGVINIPGDTSSASFFIVAAILLPHSHIKIRSVVINPSRIGVIRVLMRMGADIRIIPTNTVSSELIGDIIVRHSRLRATRVKSNEIGQLIDELPILMLASCFARGLTIIYGVEELRFKETDRINSMQYNLRKMGADISILDYKSASGKLREKVVIRGTGCLRGARVSSFNDHRTAMSMVIAGLVCKGRAFVEDIECINKSFPGFLKVLDRVVKARG